MSLGASVAERRHIICKVSETAGIPWTFGGNHVDLTALINTMFSKIDHVVHGGFVKDVYAVAFRRQVNFCMAIKEE